MFNGLIGQDYTCERAGDELPLHDHNFNHITLCLAGEIEVFTADGKSITAKPGEAPIEYVAGQRHGIRALTDGARFLNISPVL